MIRAVHGFLPSLWTVLWGNRFHFRSGQERGEKCVINGVIFRFRQHIAANVQLSEWIGVRVHISLLDDLAMRLCPNHRQRVARGPSQDNSLDNAQSTTTNEWHHRRVHPQSRVTTQPLHPRHPDTPSTSPARDGEGMKEQEQREGKQPEQGGSRRGAERKAHDHNI